MSAGWMRSLFHPPFGISVLFFLISDDDAEHAGHSEHAHRSGDTTSTRNSTSNRH